VGHSASGIQVGDAAPEALVVSHPNREKRSLDGAPADLFLAAFSARLNRLLKYGKVEQVNAAGAEARLSFCDIYGPAKAVPLLQSRLR